MNSLTSSRSLLLVLVLCAALLALGAGLAMAEEVPVPLASSTPPAGTEGLAEPRASGLLAGAGLALVSHLGATADVLVKPLPVPAPEHPVFTTWEGIGEYLAGNFGLDFLFPGTDLADMHVGGSMPVYGFDVGSLATRAGLIYANDVGLTPFARFALDIPPDALGLGFMPESEGRIAFGLGPDMVQAAYSLAW